MRLLRGEIQPMSLGQIPFFKKVIAEVPRSPFEKRGTKGGKKGMPKR